jgi:CsoR family transcriptional regulator, copper-sensing transcriptional repressor
MRHRYPEELWQAQRGPDARIADTVRLRINVGDVMVKDGDIFGDVSLWTLPPSSRPSTTSSSLPRGSPGRAACMNMRNSSRVYTPREIYPLGTVTMDYEIRENRIFLKRTPEEKQPITSRLAKIEGQVRAIRQMIEDSRWCGDELMLSNAVTAAMREVAILIASQHLQTGLRHAASHANDEAVMADLTAVLRAAMKVGDGA